jgi:hypothetical protein
MRVAGFTHVQCSSGVVAALRRQFGANPPGGVVAYAEIGLIRSEPTAKPPRTFPANFRIADHPGAKKNPVSGVNLARDKPNRRRSWQRQGNYFFSPACQFSTRDG